MNMYGQSMQQCHELVYQATGTQDLGELIACKCTADKDLAESEMESQVLSHLILHSWGLRQTMEGVGHCLLQPLL